MSRTAQPSQNKTLHVICNILRFALGLVFVFSGFVKAIDPMGTVYKLNDYAEAFGIAGAEQTHIVLWIAMILALFEFILGICIFFSMWRRTALTTALVFIVLMTPLTLYLAIANPISDCGCFGDAVKLTNWQTFWKNVVLLAVIIFLLFHYKELCPLIRRTWDWMIIGFAFVSLYLFMNNNLRHLPAYDFRPYRIGTNLEEAMTMPEDKTPPEYETVFILEKEGKKRKFTLDNYPDSTWTFVASRTVLKKKGYTPPIHEFELMDVEGNDITEKLFEKGYSFLMILRDLRAEDMHDIINDLYDYAQFNEYPFYALTSGTDAAIKRWKEQTGALYDFYYLDDTTLKTIVRSNPGVVLIKDGTIINKWSRHDIPRDELLTGTLDEQPWAERTREERLRRYARIITLMFLPYILLILLSYIMHRKTKKNMKKE
ncbi:MAG: DoxX family protein [Bacteroidaceae bacterium]|nr:DoxX family protein [Bacteroidaceae bacterium]